MYYKMGVLKDSEKAYDKTEHRDDCPIILKIEWYTVVSPYPWGDTFKQPQWMIETMNSTKPYINYGFPTHTLYLKEALYGYSLSYPNFHLREKNYVK